MAGWKGHQLANFKIALWSLIFLEGSAALRVWWNWHVLITTSGSLKPSWVIWRPVMRKLSKVINQMDNSSSWSANTCDWGVYASRAAQETWVCFPAVVQVMTAIIQSSWGFKQMLARGGVGVPFREPHIQHQPFLGCGVSEGEWGEGATLCEYSGSHWSTWVWIFSVQRPPGKAMCLISLLSVIILCNIKQQHIGSAINITQNIFHHYRS